MRQVRRTSCMFTWCTCSVISVLSYTQKTMASAWRRAGTPTWKAPGKAQSCNPARPVRWPIKACTQASQCGPLRPNFRLRREGPFRTQRGYASGGTNGSLEGCSHGSKLPEQNLCFLDRKTCAMEWREGAKKHLDAKKSVLRTLLFSDSKGHEI